MSQNNTPGFEPVASQPQAGATPAPAPAYRPPIGVDASPIWPSQPGGAAAPQASVPQASGPQAAVPSGAPVGQGAPAAAVAPAGAASVSAQAAPVQAPSAKPVGVADAAAPAARSKVAAPRAGRRAQQRRSSGEGKRAMIGVGAVAAAVTVGVGAWLGASMLGDKGAAPGELTVGQCVNWENITDVVKRADKPVIVTDCAKAHDGEVIAIGTVPEGFDFLSRHEVILPVCTDAFDSYIGVAYSQSALSGSYFDARQSRWEDGEREFACIAHTSDGSKLEGSVKDSQR
ncbi:septum formation family protein [Buchananella felis]|uniref:septum formation family protein n=1 Tax=Buchananella felis TaxID=3231492 RepID=UPI0035287FD8